MAEALVMSLVGKRGGLRIDHKGRVWKGRRRAEYRASNGYLRIKVRVGDNSSKRLDVAAHRIVYLAKVGPIPTGHVVDHLDRDKTNNRPHNLEAVTLSQNLRLAYSRASR